MMTPDTFQQSLDRWGSRLDDWPEAERRAARSLLADNAQARAALADAERLARALQSVPPMPASDALKLRLKRIPAHYAHPGRAAAAAPTPHWTPHWWWGGGVAVVSGGVMALGFMAGFTGLISLDGSLVDWAALAYGSL